MKCSGLGVLHDRTIAGWGGWKGGGRILGPAAHLSVLNKIIQNRISRS